MCHFNVLCFTVFYVSFIIFTSKTPFGMKRSVTPCITPNAVDTAYHKEIERRLQFLAVVVQTKWLHLPAPCKHPYEKPLPATLK